MTLLENAAASYIRNAKPALNGTRNSQAFSLAGHIRAFVGEPGGEQLSEAQTVSLLRNWNTRNADPLADDELCAAVHSAFTDHGTPREPKIVKLNKSKRAPKQDAATPRLGWRPFPTHCLPHPLRGFVSASAFAFGCDESYVALPVLATCAAAIGTTRTIRLKRTWNEPCIFWLVGIGKSGVMKSPPQDLALAPLRKRELQAFIEFQRQLLVYREQFERFEVALKSWKANGINDGKLRPIEPVRPVCVRYTTADTTAEALAVLIMENPRGMLLARDEVSGWVGSFNQYRSGKGGDEARWLELFRGGVLSIDRKNAEPRVIRVERAAASVTGTIQPGVARRAFTREHFESGLAARLLVCWPPAREKRWSESELSAQVETEYDALIGRLLELKHHVTPDGSVPMALPLTAGGKLAWIDFYDEHAKAQAKLTSDDLAAAWSKIEGYAARFALLFHCVRVAAQDSTLDNADAIDDVSVGAGVTLARWFAHEAERVYGALAGMDELAADQRLLTWLHGRGGSATARDLYRAMTGEYSNNEAARAAFDRLAQLGYGRWGYDPTGPTGGAPSARFSLTATTDTTKTPNGDPVARGSVSVSCGSDQNEGNDA